jgi:hypothetical protein
MSDEGWVALSGRGSLGSGSGLRGAAWSSAPYSTSPSSPDLSSSRPQSRPSLISYLVFYYSTVYLKRLGKADNGDKIGEIKLFVIRFLFKSPFFLLKTIKEQKLELSFKG